MGSPKASGLETMVAGYNCELITTRVCSQIDSKCHLMFESHVEDKLQISIWQFFEQFAFVNNHLVCYWLTFHNLILKSCNADQPSTTWLSSISSSRFSLFNSNHNMPNVCIQDFWYFVSGLDIPPKQSLNNNPACKKRGCRLQQEVINLFFLQIDMNMMNP